MTPDAAALLLKNLLDRLDADAETERPQFRGVVSDDERDALRLLLEDADHVPRARRPPTRPRVPPKERTSPPGGSRVELNTDALSLVASPASNWTLCLDFGTAKSKAFAASDSDEPELVELPIGKADHDIDGSVYAASSSMWVDDNGLVFVGSEAVKRGMSYGEEPTASRRRLDSLKQELSQATGTERLRQRLGRDVDPTSTLTYEDAIIFYLAYLTDLAATELEKSRIGTRYVKRRFTLPWWTAEQRQWAGKFITHGLTRAQVLADTFHGRWQEGIRVEQVKKAVRDAAAHDSQLAWLLEPASKEGVLEALATASGRIWRDNEARELMLVVDVGAGTTDLSLFWVAHGRPPVARGGAAEGQKAFPVMPCGSAVKQAGDTLDSLLVAELLRRADLGADTALRQRVVDDLYRSSVRQWKERLLTGGEITVKFVSDHTVRLSKAEFLELKGVRTFAEEIRNRIQALLDEVHESWADTVEHRGITLVLAGGGCDLPMVRALGTETWKIGGRRIRGRLAKSVPDLVADELGADFAQEYPQLAVAMGGAMPALLNEGRALKAWPGGTAPPGQLARFQSQGL